MTSINCMRKASAFFCSSAGIGFDGILRAHGLVVPDDGPHLNEIDDALESASAPMGICNGHRPRAQTLADGFEHVLEIRAVLVHLVHEANTRNLVLVALPPHRLSLRLDAGNRIEQRHRAVEHAQASAPPRR